MSAPLTSADTAAIPAAPTPEGGWLTQFARLARWELFLALRRRAMVITLGALLLVGYLAVVLVQFAIYLAAPDEAGAKGIGAGLGFPGGMGVAGGYITSAGVLLFVVLVGALIGSEYSYSTLRLSLARGVGRGQFLAAQIVAVAILALGLTAVAMLLGAATGGLGALIGMPTLVTPGLSVGETLLYWLALAYNIFCYALIAVCIGTLTRSVAGGIAGPLVFIVVEVVVTDVLLALSAFPVDSPLLLTLSHTPEYLLGSNTSALITLAGAGPYPLTSGQVISVALTWPHALIVSAIYCALFIASSYLVLRNRDVVE